MQARKRRLEKELKLEERRVKLLEERLNETERAREEAHVMILKIEKGVLKFQTLARRRMAMKRYGLMKYKLLMMRLIAIFLQSHYRGWKGRSRAQSIRQYYKQKLMDESATAIQAVIRRCIQRKYYIDKLLQKEILSNEAASSIQRVVRGQITRRLYQEQMRHRQCAASNIQRVFRGKMGRDKAVAIRKKILLRKRAESEKPKRIPLHLRRYSTYGTNAKAPRRANKGTRKRDVTILRRGSDALVMSKDGRTLGSTVGTSAGYEPDENDSVATTITSLTHTTEHSCKRAERRKVSDGIKARANSSIQKGLTIASNSKNNNEGKQALSCESIEGEINSHKQGQRFCGKNANEFDCSETSSCTCIKIDTKKAPRERQKSLYGDVDECRTLPIDSQTPPEECRQSSAQARKKSDSRNASYVRRKSVNRDLLPQKCSRYTLRTCTETNLKQSQHERIESARSDGEIFAPNYPRTPSRKKIKTPIIISEEAALIVEEVLGQGMMAHSIVHSVFEDDFSEHEDDLEL